MSLGFGDVWYELQVFFWRLSGRKGSPVGNDHICGTLCYHKYCQNVSNGSFITRQLVWFISSVTLPFFSQHPSASSNLLLFSLSLILCLSFSFNVSPFYFFSITLYIILHLSLAWVSTHLSVIRPRKQDRSVQLFYFLSSSWLVFCTSLCLIEPNGWL